MKALTLEQFINRAKNIHNNQYEYPNQEFINTKKKVKIFCKKGNHFFHQQPSIHLLGKGCKKCSLRKTKSKFLEEAFLKYKNRFTYDLNNYKFSTSKIKILCNDCKYTFETKSINHLVAKNGCPQCAKKQAKENITKSFESFKKLSIERNGDIFNFITLELPFKRKSLISVICKFCNNTFISHANNILNKSGCPSCSHNSKHPNTEGFIYQLYYDGHPILYVGITTCTLKIRLRRHIDAVKYKKSNTKLYHFLKDKDLKLLSIKEVDRGKAYELAKKEDFWINKLNTKYPLGLNKNRGGSGLNLKYIKNE